MRNGRAVVGVVLSIAAAGGAVQTIQAAGGGDAMIGGAAVAGAGAVRVDPPPRTFSLLFAGDVITENAVLAAAAGAATGGARYDFGALLAPIEPIVAAADLAVCHMELPVGTPGLPAANLGRSAVGANRLRAPFELIEGLAAAGFDRCSTASNHSNDAGIAGIDSTLGGLDALGLTHTGTARSPAEAAPSAAVVTVGDVHVAHLAYTMYTNTGLPAEPWRLSYTLSPGRVAGDVQAARAAGAEVVVVSLHLRIEMQTAPTDEVRTFVEQLLALAPVDAVVAHGPHVVQPLETVGGTPVFWSIGNLLSGGGVAGAGRYADPRTTDGLLATFRITQGTGGAFAVEAVPVPICLDTATRRVWPASALDDPATPAAVRPTLQACAARTAAVLSIV